MHFLHRLKSVWITQLGLHFWFGMQWYRCFISCSRHTTTYRMSAHRPCYFGTPLALPLPNTHHAWLVDIYSNCSRLNLALTLGYPSGLDALFLGGKRTEPLKWRGESFA